MKPEEQVAEITKKFTEDELDEISDAPYQIHWKNEMGTSPLRNRAGNLIHILGEAIEEIAEQYPDDCLECYNGHHSFSWNWEE